VHRRPGATRLEDRGSNCACVTQIEIRHAIESHAESVGFEHTFKRFSKRFSKRLWGGDATAATAAR